MSCDHAAIAAISLATEVALDLHDEPSIHHVPAESTGVASPLDLMGRKLDIYTDVKMQGIRKLRQIYARSSFPSVRCRPTGF